MRPFDPRLLRVARSLRTLLPAAALLAALQAAATVGFAWAVGTGLADVIQGEPDPVPLLVAVAAVSLRAVATWADEALAARASASARSELRAAAIAHVGVAGAASPVDAATALGRGLEALDGYVGRFLPQLTRTIVAVPIVVVAVLVQDVLAGIAIAVTLPLVPVFMALIGMATETVQRRQWRETERLARSTLDTLEGLGTLKIFRRDRKARTLVAERSADHATRTMQVLRVSFLSSLVLELAASLAIAIVAVSVGVRLIEGEIALATAFSVLVLVPDAFLPVRMVGSAFHASTEGVEATRRVLDLLETEPPAAALPAAGEGLTLESAGAARSAARVTATIARGDVAVLRGPSGVGKSSLFASMLGLATSEGRIGLDGVALQRADIAWAPQRAQDALVAATVRENIALGGSDAHVDEAVRLAGVDLDLDAVVDPATGGVHGASGGQLQRVVLARALRRCLDGAPVLLADEPTSALDATHEASVIAGLRAVAALGAIVVVASHRPAVAAAADQRIEMRA